MKGYIESRVRLLFRKRKLAKVKSTESGKLDYLESIRGLAALTVLFAHIAATYYPAAGVGASAAPVNNELIYRLFYGLPLGFVIGGHFAVVVFFVLSGFVLTYKFFQSHKEHDLHKQMAKRYLRLAIPIFAIVMASYLMLANEMMNSVDKVVELTGSPENARIFNFEPNLFGAFYDATLGTLVFSNASYNPVLWTMSIEFIGSFLVLGLAALSGTLKRRWFVYIVAVIILNFSYLTCFVLGMFLADLAQNTKFIDFMRTRVSVVYSYIALAIVWVLASMPFPTSDIGSTFYQSLLMPGVADSGFRYWHFLGAFLLLTVILVRLELQKILSWRVFVFLGGISFALYLTHYLILHSIGDWLYVALRTNHDIGMNTATLIVSIVVISVTLIVSVLWKKYIDDLSVAVSRSVAQAFLK